MKNKFFLTKLNSIIILVFALFLNSNRLLASEFLICQELSDEVTFSYVDIDNYLKAYDLYKKGGNPYKIFQEEYFDKASPAMLDAINRADFNVETFVKSIETYPKYYYSLLDIKEQLVSKENEINKAINLLKSMYDKIELPTVNYMISGFSFGGNGSILGPLVAADIFGLKEDTDLNELKKGKRDYDAAFNIDKVVSMVVHEIIHSLQISSQGIEQYKSIYRDNKSVLANAIREGTADFFAKLLTGDTILDKLHIWGDENEMRIWKEFEKDKSNKSYGDWFYRSPKEKEEWSQNVGYYIGSKIVQYYYENHKNKRIAIKKILSVTNYDKFLTRSHYHQKFLFKNRS